MHATKPEKPVSFTQNMYSTVQLKFNICMCVREELLMKFHEIIAGYK